MPAGTLLYAQSGGVTAVINATAAAVIEFYRQHGQLTVVDGVGSLDEVFTRILGAVAPVREVG